MKKRIVKSASKERLKNLLALAGLCALSIASFACGSNTENIGNTSSGDKKAANQASSEEIMQHYRSLPAPPGSTIEMQVQIVDSNGSSREIQMTTYEKKQADGTQLMLIEFTAPPIESDRSALIKFSPRGDVSATRYAQSTNNFVTVTDPASEDSLFGMTLQELAYGQAEKYDFTLAGEDKVGSLPVYRMQGKLKEGAESKFPRIDLMISEDNYTALGADFYDSQNDLIRRMRVDEMKQVDNYWTRMDWHVDNVARNKKIRFKTLSAKYDTAPADSLFTQEHLKKIATR